LFAVSALITTLTRQDNQPVAFSDDLTELMALFLVALLIIMHRIDDTFAREIEGSIGIRDNITNVTILFM